MKNIEIVVPIKEYSIDECEKQKRELIEAAREATQTSYAPYSTYNVGAAVLLDNGEIVKGSNQENAAYTNGICAERTALFYAGATYPDKKILKIVVVAKGDFADMESLLSPCGGCRQVMLESEERQNEPIEVILVSQNEKTVLLKTVRDLLPFAFVSAKS